MIIDHNNCENIDLMIIIPSIRYGGAEKFTINLYNELIHKGVNCTLVVLGDRVGYYELLNNKKQVVFLNKKTTARAIYALIKLIKHVKPNNVLSMFTHLNSIILFLSLLKVINTTIYIREVNLASKIIHKKRFSWPYKYAYKYLYPYAKHVICQSQDMRCDFEKYSQAMTTTINNPVDLSKVNTLAALKNDHLDNASNKINLLFIGRLSYQKGIDTLIDFAALLDERFHLHIFGDGELTTWLTEQIQTQGLQSKVTYHGITDNPYAKMYSASRLIFSSRYEGFPNVVAESLSLGLPVISLPFIGGRQELLNISNSVIAIDQSALALFHALTASLLIDFDKNKISAEIALKYNLSDIANQYLKVLEI